MSDVACTDEERCPCRQLAFVYDQSIVKSLFDEAPNRYQDRKGGYWPGHCRASGAAGGRS